MSYATAQSILLHRMECDLLSRINDLVLNFQDESGSTLTMINVSVSDSGNYSCQPRDMRPDSVVVTILSERQAPDALQDKTTHTSGKDIVQLECATLLISLSSILIRISF